MSKILPKYDLLASVNIDLNLRLSEKLRLMNYHEFGWQFRFYHRIIQNDEELKRIKYYINKNPKNITT